jgi:myo-inositol 2-dehydrogenase/D-chiro-inositol 1-dehydrogenase
LTSVTDKTPFSPSGEDGLKAQILADAATESVRIGAPVRVG